jgi:hypothetical protein
LKEKLKKEQRLDSMIEDFGKRFHKRPWKEIKDKKYVKDQIDEFVNKAL